MFYFNSSAFTQAELSNIFPANLRVVFVATICTASTLGNVVILVVFYLSMQKKGNNRCRVIDIIIAALALASLCRSLVLGPMKAASFMKGEWALGDSMCQLQAYFEATMRNLIIWFHCFLSIERYIKHKIPHEYLVTFSPLTVNIVLPGIFLIVIVQVTGPLYGWGKYEYVDDIGLCGAATMSTFGCSYAVYLLFSLTLPPFIVILVNSLLFVSLVWKKNGTIMKNFSCGNSRMLNAEIEAASLIVYMAMFTILSIPRCAADVIFACNGMDNFIYLGIYGIYFTESLTDLLLPMLCLGLHSNSRKILFEAFRKSESSMCEEAGIGQSIAKE